MRPEQQKVEKTKIERVTRLKTGSTNGEDYQDRTQRQSTDRSQEVQFKSAPTKLLEAAQPLMISNL